MVVVRTVAGQIVRVEPRAVEDALRDVLPEPLTAHFVVVNGRRFPPKQVVAVVTGIDRADFTTHHARRILQRAGFSVGRVGPRGAAPGSAQASDRTAWPHGGAEADALRPFAGRWVAQRDLDVLVDADDPTVVLRWLEQHGQEGASIFRVPRTSGEAETWQLR